MKGVYAHGMACLLAFALLAGCSQKPAGEDPTLNGNLQQVVGAGGSTGSGAPTEEGFGALQGTVTDESNLTLPGASVSLLSTSFFMNTGKKGEFSFPRVAAGSYKVRVLASGFQAYEGSVVVESRKVTRATISLVPSDTVGPGYRQHLHDFWGNQASLVLADMDLDLTTPPYTEYGVNSATYPATEVAYKPNTNYTWMFRIPTERSDGRPAIVWPGSVELQATVTWSNSGTLKLDQMGLTYKTAGSNAQRAAAPLPSGKTAIIPVPKGATDSGHQAWTLWNFGLYTGTHYNQGASFSPALARGSVHVKLVLVRGAVSLDDPHVDRWGSNTTLLVRDFNRVETFTTLGADTRHTYAILRLDEKKLIPPGTAKLHLKMAWASTDAAGSALDGDFEASWKPADEDPNATPYSAYHTAKPTKVTGNVKEYDIDLKPEQTDAFYQVVSNWMFRMYEPRWEDVPEGATDFHHKFQLEVIAFKDPNFR